MDYFHWLLIVLIVIEFFIITAVVIFHNQKNNQKIKAIFTISYHEKDGDQDFSKIFELDYIPHIGMEYLFCDDEFQVVRVIHDFDNVSDRYEFEIDLQFKPLGKSFQISEEIKNKLKQEGWEYTGDDEV